jgi:hypothetical protein
MKNHYGTLPITIDGVNSQPQPEKTKPYIVVMAFVILYSLSFYLVFTFGTAISNSSTRSSFEASNNITQPNFLFIMLDDLMWRVLYDRDNDMAEYCPNLISLMGVGVNISHYYSQQMCIPARASMFTGKYPIHIGYQRQYVYIDTYGSLDLNTMLLPQVLKNNSYHTYLLGKWHLGHYTPEYLPTARGFDAFIGYLGHEEGHWSKISPRKDYIYTDFIQSNTTCFGQYEEPNLYNFSTFLYRDLTINILERYDEQSDPFYLQLALQAPHSPFYDVDHWGIPSDYVASDVYESIQENVVVIKDYDDSYVFISLYVFLDSIYMIMMYVKLV